MNEKFIKAVINNIKNSTPITDNSMDNFDKFVAVLVCVAIITCVLAIWSVQ